ncbi:hypothetical protein [Alienimonas chondri]|uniref:Uncharacterized protein n=1 Tax=Alienimonas chondri TaxID=2681879 RepID=A0ABX1V845_9PLAN|nr:hypothetical protein [Alienimonas chondri]NNJ24354.1 hypothetical protein [Alienimonas chondri]
MGGKEVATMSIDEQRFAELTSFAIGLPITRVWLGDYTALYIEIGPLTKAYCQSGRPKAEHTAYLGFQWVLESGAGREFSSTDPDAASRIVTAISGERIRCVTASPSLELILSLHSGRLLRSVASEPDEPEWSLYFPAGSVVYAHEGSLVLESVSV